MKISAKPIFYLTMKNQIEIPTIEADTGMFNQYNITHQSFIAQFLLNMNRLIINIVTPLISCKRHPMK